MIPADARSGSTLGKYRLHEIVGRGGMGVVYRAEHVYIGREVALKILHEGYGGREESVKRFLREARAASLINHPNIVEVTDFGKGSDGTVFFVMELLIGEPLDAILAREQRLDLMRSIVICNQLTAALAAAHSKGIIHRDLKPENVMLIPREGRRELVRRVADEGGAHELSEREKQFDFVKILDFGVAKVREPETSGKGKVTQAGVVFGTPEYMAPETARIGFSDARSDIYALGVMFYEMITGTVPFTGDAPVDVMMKQVNERVPRMHDVTPDAEITEDAERMILKALAKDPDHRQQSMEEFHRDLQKCYGQLRFRRTVRTPKVNQNTPHIATIQLTKKKQPQQPGAGSGGGGAQSQSQTPAPTGAGVISVEIVAEPPSRPRAMTPKLPGLPMGVSGPILLTKKKARLTADTPPGDSRSGRTPDGLGEGGMPGASGDAPAEKKRRATMPLSVGKGTTHTPPPLVLGAPPSTRSSPFPMQAPRPDTSKGTGQTDTPLKDAGAKDTAQKDAGAKDAGKDLGKKAAIAAPTPRAASAGASAASAAGTAAGKFADEPPTPRVSVNDSSWLNSAGAALKIKHGR